MLDQATVALEVFDHDKDDALNKDTEVTEVSENVYVRFKFRFQRTLNTNRGDKVSERVCKFVV